MPQPDYLMDSGFVDDTVFDIKNADIIRLQITDSLYDVVMGLITNHISKIFVYEGKKPVGIITDKDIIRFLYNERSGRKFDQIPAGEVMNNICYAVDSLTCKQAAQTMLINKISSLGIGSSSALDGIVTKTDLLYNYVNRSRDSYKVSDFMMVSYFSAPAESNLYEIIKKMITCDISRVLLTEDQKPVGIITNGDIFRITTSINKLNIVQSSLTDHSDENTLWSESGFVGSKQAGEAMMEGIITINSDQSMKDAARLMLERRIDGLGVNNPNGELVGIINKTNVLYAMASSK